MATSTNAPLPLEGKTAIVTGASRGLGHGIAWELARQGASVVLSYTSESSKAKIEELEQNIAALPHKPKAHGIRADLASTTGAKELVDDLLAWAGQSLRVDILVNNAGMEVVKDLGDIAVEDYDKVYNINVRGAILLTQAVLPYLNANGRIINMSSVGARTPFKHLSLYCSSKAALEGLTRCWAAELGAHGTTVNAVAPGPVQSEMLDNIPKEIVQSQKDNTPVENRLGTVEEIANIVTWLASPTSSWITGQVISASGGWMVT